MAPALLASPFSPIKIVNDRVITQYEYDQRLLFLQILRQPGDLEAEAIKGLIDDRLRMGAADQFGIKLPAEAVKAGMEEFAGRANLTAEKFIEVVGKDGIEAQSFRDFVEAGLVWREIVRGKYGGTIQISDAAVDRALAAQKPLAAIKVRLAEISIPAVGAGRGQALALARKLKQEIIAGADFAAAARSNSTGPTAGRGGTLDWLRLAELDPDAALAVRGLAPGQISVPVLLDDRAVIYQMIEQGTDEAGAAPATVVDYAQFLIADGADTAAKVRATVDSCDDLYTLARGLPADRLLRQTVLQTQLPADVAGALANLDAGESSTALKRGGFRVFLMLCRRGAAETEQPTRDEVRLQLVNQRLGSLAEIYLEELRSDAIIREP